MSARGGVDGKSSHGVPDGGQAEEYDFEVVAGLSAAFVCSGGPDADAAGDGEGGQGGKGLAIKGSGPSPILIRLPRYEDNGAQSTAFVPANSVCIRPGGPGAIGDGTGVVCGAGEYVRLRYGGGDFEGGARVKSDVA